MTSTVITVEQFEAAKSTAVWVTQDQPCNGQMVMLMHKIETDENLSFTTQIFVFETDCTYALDIDTHQDYRAACEAVMVQMLEEHNYYD